MNWEFLIQNKESLLVSTDTRNLPAGCVFFALHGANFDGNKFAQQALEQGASLVVIDDPEVFSTLNSQPSTFNIQHSTFNFQRSTLNFQRSTFNIQLSTLNSQHSTSNHLNVSQYLLK
mgnify:CR=1 FL=1